MLVDYHICSTPGAQRSIFLKFFGWEKDYWNPFCALSQIFQGYTTLVAFQTTSRKQIIEERDRRLRFGENSSQRSLAEWAQAKFRLPHTPGRP